jgi:hypothetical protein
VEADALRLVGHIVSLAIGSVSILIAIHLYIIVASKTGRNGVSVSNLHPAYSIAMVRIEVVPQCLPRSISPDIVGANNIAIV